MFPCDQFGEGEPAESNQDIYDYLTKDFGVTFPISTPVDVNGVDADQAFVFLRTHSSYFDNERNVTAEVTWNFAKFLVTDDGESIMTFDPFHFPVDIIPAVEAELGLATS